MLEFLTIPTADRVWVPPGVERKNRASDMELLAAEPMMRLGVEGSIPQELPDRRSGAGLPHRRGQERRIVAGTPRDDGGEQQMAAMVAYQSELQPGPIALRASATPPQEIRAGMMVFQTRGVDAGRDILCGQQEFLGPCAELIEQPCAPPFLASRWAAFWRVVK